MSLLRFILSALAAASIATAASCSSSDTLTIESQGDAAQLATCVTYTGNIAISTSASGAISIDGVRSITGDLTIKNAPNITTFGASSLQSVGGTFTLDNCQVLGALNFPRLTSVGEIDFEGLPNLNSLGFGSTVSQCNTLNIQNTFLGSLDGINLQKVKSIYIANNRMLQSISFQVTNLAGSLTLESNGDRLQAQFPNLESAQNLTFRNCPSVSIPSLQNLTGNLGVYESTLTDLSAVNLTLVGGTLAINGNTQLNNVSLPILKTINGGIQVQNNTILQKVNLPSLTTIGGAFDFYGNFTDVKLPALKDCRGGFNLQSSSDVSSDCNTFKAESGSNNAIKGKFQCAANLSKPGNSGTTASGGSSSTKTGAASPLNVPSSSIMGFAGLLAVMLGML